MTDSERTSLKIGIKYCGGCNPTYSREVIESSIRKYFPDAQYLYTSKTKDVDVLVIICGCKTACVKIPTENSEKIAIFDEYLPPENVKEKIKEVLKV